MAQDILLPFSPLSCSASGQPGRPGPTGFRALFVGAAALVFVLLALTGRSQSILPDAVSGQPYQFTVVSSPPQPAGTVYSAQGLPPGLSVDASTGVFGGTTTNVGLYKGTLTLASGGSTSPFLFQITVDPAAGAPTITSNGSANGTVGTPFLYTLEASNSPASYNIAQLPPGLSASGNEITGTPTTAGLFFTSMSANNGAGQGAVLVIMFTISPTGPIPADTSPLTVTTSVGASFSYTLTATNSPTSFAATGLPAGLSLNSSTGVISGTPTAAGITDVPIEETNSYGSSLPAKLIITVGAYSSITSASTATATAGSSFTYSLAAGNSPYSYAVSGIPAGLQLNGTSGAISGTPTTAGTYTLTAVATNALGAGPPATITLSVKEPVSGNSGPTPPLIIAEPQAESVVLGSTAQFSVGAVGTGALAYQWSLNGIPIAGQDGPTLTLAFANEDDAGSYTVAVTSALGTAASTPSALTILSLFVPPSITSYPEKLTATSGSPVTFTVGAAGTATLNFQWLVDGVPIPGATSATLTLPSVQVSDAGTYSARVTNAEGSATSPGAALTVAASPFAPIFEYQPGPTSVTVGGSATMSVGIVGSPPISYQWFKGGTAVVGATASSISFSPAALADAGVYSVSITDPAGTVTSAGAQLTVNPAGGPPVQVSIVVQPVPASVAQGGSASFFVQVTGDGPITYTWRKNQEPIPGATGPSFTVSDLHPSDAGIYDIEVANAFSATISFPTLLVVTPSGMPTRIINLSARGFSGAGDKTLIVGIVVGGTGAKEALVRAVGPTLAEFGVTGTLADPQLSLFSAAGAAIASNDNWGGTPALSAEFAQTGAFALSPGSLDSAVLTTLQPGQFTAQVQGANGGTGVVLLEAYDADLGPTPPARLVNVSARGFTGPGSGTLTAGFVLSGASSETILIRGIGPSLTGFSVAGALPDPLLIVLDSNGKVVASNQGWGGSAALQAAFDSISAFPLSTTSADSAVRVTLPPGAYTAQVGGASGDSGIALLEVYELP